MFLFRLEDIGISSMGTKAMAYANTFERYQFFSWTKDKTLFVFPDEIGWCEAV
jgi:hypothetical protein